MDPIDVAAPRVLIVEDEFIVALDLAESLRGLGYAVSGQVETAEQALAAVGLVRPDVVLMDIQLKGPADGVAAAAEIRERWSVPVVFVTANANADTLARAKASGPFGFIAKPFRLRELDATIGIALNQHKLTRELFADRGWLTSVTASLSDGVIATNSEGVVRYMNPAAEAMLRRRSGGAFGQPVEAAYTLSTLEGKPVEVRPVRAALATREPVPKRRFLLHTGDGRPRPIEASAAPIVEDGKLLGAVTVFTRIDEQIAKETAEVRLRESLQDQVETTSMALGDSRQALQALSHRLMVAEEGERARIARELHDDLGQRTALLDMKLRGLEAAAPAHQRPLLASAQHDLAELAAGLREVSHRLHPAVIADLGLAAALESLVNDFREQGLAVEGRLEDVPSPPVEVATALYRIAQEALKNVEKHARHTPVRVRLRRVDDRLQLSIEDEGPGFSMAEVRRRGGLGLLSMQERARPVGATLLVSSQPGRGATVTASVALAE